MLHISRGDWLLVKKRLTVGETRQMFEQMAGGAMFIKSGNVGISKVQAYLLDWSITDADDNPVPILDQPDGVVLSALDNLNPEDFKEILDAIETHMAKVEQEDAERKKRLDGGSASSRDLPSASASTGATSGLTNSLLMSTR